MAEGLEKYPLTDFSNEPQDEVSLLASSKHRYGARLDNPGIRIDDNDFTHTAVRQICR